MPTALFHSATDRAEPWLATMAVAMPELAIRVYPEIGEAAEIDYAILSHPPDDALHTLPNLKAMFSIFAGIDQLTKHADALPAGIPLVRMVDTSLTEGMGEYVVFHVLRFHREMDAYARYQAAREWRPLEPVRACHRRVGILGLGVLGADAARKLVALGFDVAGWSRSPKTLDRVTSYHGAGQLAAFLASTQILVCLLPMTADTAGLIDAGLLATLPPGATLINAARGGIVVDADLLAALDNGHIAGAALDVFNQEPLPADHPYWGHDKVFLTPHAASLTLPETAADHLARSIRAHIAGEALDNLVDFSRGY